MTEIKIPEAVSFILLKLVEKGYEAYVVGGCVRDSILGLDPKDWDICTSATTNEMKEVFVNSFFTLVPTGEEYGTMTLMINKVGYEITTFRNDGRYSDGRHPDDVNFVKSIKEDLSRRDFTMNAIAYNEVNGIIDPFGGIADIKNKVVRCVGDAEERFTEDPLRMMRAVRFTNRLNFGLCYDSIGAINKLRKKMEFISAERIREELNKIIIDNPIGIEMLHQLGLLEVIIPELELCFNTIQNNPYHKFKNIGKHIVDSMKHVPDVLTLRLAMMFHDIGKPSKKTTDENGIDHFYKHELASNDITEIVMLRLKYDNKIIGDVCKLVVSHSFNLVGSKKQARKLLNRLGEMSAYDLVSVCIADDYAKDTTKLGVRENIANAIMTEHLLSEVIEDKECFKLKDLMIDGYDLIDIGISQGVLIGEILSTLITIVIETPVMNERESLLSFVYSNWEF